MPQINQLFQRWLYPKKPLPSGIYHYIAPPQDPRNYRLHLRLEPSGQGVLVVNASTILHLNQTAAEYSYYLVHNYSPDQTAKQMVQRYNVPHAQAKEDYQKLVDRILTLIEIPDLDPETFLDFERAYPHTLRASAPYRLDCAITYRPAGPQHDETAPVDRVKRELNTEEWKKILSKAWELGIFHIVFTGGEPTLRDDLPELLDFAELQGQVTGIITHGQRLVETGYLTQLLNTGLDHIMLIFEPDEPFAWQTMSEILSADIFLAVHLTVRDPNLEIFSELLNKLQQLGVKSISLSCSRPELETTLHQAREMVAQMNLNLVWNLPVPYSSYHPISLETTNWGMNPGAGNDWLYLEPDGDVLPAQGINEILGNFLIDPWEKIWKHAK